LDNFVPRNGCLHRLKKPPFTLERISPPPKVVGSSVRCVCHFATPTGKRLPCGDCLAVKSLFSGNSW